MYFLCGRFVRALVVECLSMVDDGHEGGWWSFLCSLVDSGSDLSRASW